jgi:beta-galactosidase/beta-glucuronidase
MKKVLFVLSVAAVLCSISGRSQTGFGKAGKINDGWKFTLNDSVGYQNASVSDNKWRNVNLPHDWSVEGQLSPSLASCTGFLPGGIGWYRKSLAVPADKKGEKVYLYFEGVYNRSEVYINGQLLGKRPNGYISFAYDATPYINYGGDNVIAVRVDHSQSADSRWYTGSGIYRNVWVVYANPVHIAQWGTYAYPEVKGATGTLNTEVEVENNLAQNAAVSVLQELLDANGKIVAKSTENLKVMPNGKNTVKSKLTVKNARLWDINSPSLYTLKVTVTQNGKVIDQSTVKTGFRTFTFDANKGFALNGKWMKMKGVCLHHDAGVLGAAVPREVWHDRLLTLKNIGVNAIRTTHNPQSPDFYELCDEIGLLVLNEAYDEWEYPKRKWIEGWNVGTPGFQGSFDIFAQWSEKDLEDMVRRDRNHPSVFAWSIGNEVDYPNDPYSHPVLNGGKDTGFSQAIYGGYKKDAPNAERLGGIAKRLTAAVKRYDKSRPVTAGLAGVAMSNETEYPGALDITGYNYTESKYDTDHAKYPKRVIYGSENRHDMESWLAVKNNEHIFGQFLWTGFDYLGESGRWPSRGFYSGLVDFSGNTKPRGYFRKALWYDKPFIYAGTYINRRNSNELSMDAWPVWNYDKGQSVRVVSYMNTPSAKLYLNGKQVGEEKQYDEKTGIVYWDVPYESGKLEVAGFDKAKETCRYAIISSAQPYKLIVKAGATTLDKNKGVVELRVEVLDDKGVPVMLSDNEVTCKISGPVKLLGLEAGNNEDMTDYTDNVQRVHHGKILAYIEAQGDSGEAIISFSSPWLQPAEIKIQVK